MGLRFARALGPIALLVPSAFPAVAQTPAETKVLVEAGPEAVRVGVGRLLLFAQKVDPAAGVPVSSVSFTQFSNRKAFVAAREVTGLAIGRRLRFDADDLAFPAPYWRKNRDISQIIRNRWAELAPDLDGKVRVIVGDKDEADLDDSARRLQAAFEAVGGRASFTYMPGKGHFDLYAEGSERMALRRKIAREMWKVARPSSPLTDPGPPPPPTAPSLGKATDHTPKPQT
jgi:hypothetical protein